jgi:hypothetical protein
MFIFTAGTIGATIRIACVQKSKIASTAAAASNSSFIWRWLLIAEGSLV